MAGRRKKRRTPIAIINRLRSKVEKQCLRLNNIIQGDLDVIEKMYRKGVGESRIEKGKHVVLLRDELDRSKKRIEELEKRIEDLENK